MLLPVIAMLSSLAEIPPPDTNTYYDCPAGQAVFSDTRVSISSQTTADYEIRLYTQPHCFFEDDGPGKRHTSNITGVKVFKAGKEIYSQTGYNLHVGYPQPSNLPVDAVLIKPGDDITGEGIPELLVSEWSGRGRCCLTFHLFRLGKEFMRLQDIPLLDADETAFVRLPARKGLVLATWDYSDFANFLGHFDGSPAGRVYLSFQDGGYRPDLVLMKATAPAPGVTDKCAELFKNSSLWKPHWHDAKPNQPKGMWYYATDLIYTGNAEQAWKFLDAAWGGSSTDKKKYLDDYRQRFKKSAYYPELMQLQQVPVSSAGQKIDWTKQCFAYLHG